jgi:dTDP-4-amino-4,6-dideoxygalactose transaminase/acetyltransferase-like isoleucine patch superfamily enzyme
MLSRKPFIHPTAVVEPGACIGDSTSVWHHSHIRRGSVIGAHCTLGKNVFIDEGVRVGDHVKVQNNVSVYRGVELGDEVLVGPSAVFTNDLRPRAAGGSWQPLATPVRRGASIGANATIVCGVEIGEYGMVGAGAVVTASVHPHQLVVGNPARHQAWICACGEVVSRSADRPARLSCGACDPRAGAPADLRSPGGSSGDLIRLTNVEIGEAEEAAVLAVLRSGHLAGGARVAELEEKFARTHGSRHAVAVSSGTAALVTALRAHQIGPGDEVITSPLTFVATLNAILETGATARFCDVTDDLTLDPGQLCSLVTPRTRAILPVHLYGLPADMKAIGGFAARHHLTVIQDAAQAHGASIDGRPLGAFGTAAFSFYATKNIMCGEGGIVVTNDDAVAEGVRLLRNHGMRAADDYALPGQNYRLTDIQAAIVTVQLDRLAAINCRRSRNASVLSAGLAGLDGLRLPAVPAGRDHAWHQYTVELTADAPVSRDELRKRLAADGIDAKAYYPRLVHDYPCYHEHPGVLRDPAPRAERAASHVLSLPVNPALTGSQLDRIIAAVRAALHG